MDRRAFVSGITLGLLAAPLAAGGQSQRVPKIGWLSDGVAGIQSHPREEAFVQGLRDLGYIEGQSIIIERRDAEGKLEQLPKLAAELVKLGVDVIVTTGGVPATSAAKHATNAIPIVMTEAGDPVGTGLVASLNRPGGNITGLSTMDPDLTRKRLQLLKETAPRVARVAVLHNPTFPATTLALKDAHAAAPVLSLTILPMAVRTGDDLDKAFTMVIKAGGDSLLTFGDPFTTNQQTRILDLTAKHRLPAMYFLPDFAQAGGLMAYGPSLPDMYRRAATYVDRILKGAKPGDLPIEQPTKFELVINLKTAKALGLTIPQSLLQRADQVIE
jgi:putative ABC transport system substrate-binding protein